MARDYLPQTVLDATDAMLTYNPMTASTKWLMDMGGDADGETFADRFDDQKQDLDAFGDVAWKEHPTAYGAGAGVGMIGQMAAPAGAWVKGAGVLRNLGVTGGVGAGLGAAQEFGDGYDINERIDNAATGAVWGGALGALGAAGANAILAAVKGVKSLAQSAVAPERLARQHFDEAMIGDRVDYARNAIDAEAAGREAPTPNFMFDDELASAFDADLPVSALDLGGNRVRGLAKQARTTSADLEATLDAFLSPRQAEQADRVKGSLEERFGTAIDPAQFEDELQAAARSEIDARYATAMDAEHAQHVWNPRLANVLGTSAGERALKSAIQKSSDQAMMNGDDALEPVFSRDAKGRLQLSGFKSGDDMLPPDDAGLSLRFWDSVKRSVDNEIGVAQRAGAKEEAAQLQQVKTSLVNALDGQVPEYKRARMSASAAFGGNDALEAGRNFYKAVDSYKVGDIKRSVAEMGNAERSLFARSFAGEMINSTQGPEGAKPLLKKMSAPTFKQKMRLALGDENANAVEALTRFEHIMSTSKSAVMNGSDTARNIMRQEALGVATNAAAGAGLNYMFGTGDLTTGGIMGLAVRGGYRFHKTKMSQRYADEIARLATTADRGELEDQLYRLSQDKGFRELLEAVSQGTGK